MPLLLVLAGALTAVPLAAVIGSRTKEEMIEQSNVKSKQVNMLALAGGALLAYKIFGK